MVRRALDAVRSVGTGARELIATGRGRLILAFVAIQLVLPVRYYACNRDPHDERFAWRMFSPIRMARCTPTFALDGKPVALGNEFHEAWLEIAGRGRLAVVEAMGAKLCAKHAGAKVSAQLSCSYVEAPARAFASDDLCTHPVLEPAP